MWDVQQQMELADHPARIKQAEVKMARREVGEEGGTSSRGGWGLTSPGLHPPGLGTLDWSR